MTVTRRYRSEKPAWVARRYRRQVCGLHMSIHYGSSRASAYQKYFINGNFWILRPNDPDTIAIVQQEKGYEH